LSHLLRCLHRHGIDQVGKSDCIMHSSDSTYSKSAEGWKVGILLSH
jgi:hypothetical protein